MAEKTINTRQKQKYDTSTNWTTNNIVLLAGEIGIESDTNKFKVGNGTSAWNELDYAGGETGSIININGQPQSVVNFDSDPQTQITTLSGTVNTKVQEVVLTGTTGGTLTSQQLQTLQADDSNYILLNNEIYRLADKQYARGYRTYVHTGLDTELKNFTKSLIITISKLEWTLVSRTIVDEESGQTISGTKNFNVIKRNNQNLLSNKGLVNPAGATIDRGTFISQFVTQTNYGDFTKIDFYFAISINVTNSTTITMRLPAIFSPVPNSLFNAQVSSGGTFKNWERSNAVRITNKQSLNEVLIGIDDDTGDKIIQGHIVGILT